MIRTITTLSRISNYVLNNTAFYRNKLQTETRCIFDSQVNAKCYHILNNHKYKNETYSIKNYIKKCVSTTLAANTLIHLPLKKRPKRKRQFDFDDYQYLMEHGQYSVAAFATAEEYDIEGILEGINNSRVKKYFARRYLGDGPGGSPEDIIIATNVIAHEPTDIFFFRNGTVVFWNSNEAEIKSFIHWLWKYELYGYSAKLVNNEIERIHYRYAKAAAIQPNAFAISRRRERYRQLEKYTFSKAMNISAKLGIWERALDHFVQDVHATAELLKQGRSVWTSRDAMHKKTGELYSLRHLINTNSEFRDQMGHEWKDKSLQTLFERACLYYQVEKRSRVITEKLNHCVELSLMLSTYITQTHNIIQDRVMIIMLFCEVCLSAFSYFIWYYAYINMPSLHEIILGVNYEHTRLKDGKTRRRMFNRDDVSEQS